MMITLLKAATAIGNEVKIPLETSGKIDKTLETSGKDLKSHSKEFISL